MAFDLLEQYHSIKKPRSALFNESMGAALGGIGNISGAMLNRRDDKKAKQRELDAMREALGAESAALDLESAALDDKVMAIDDLDPLQKIYMEAKRTEIDNRRREIDTAQAQTQDDATFRNVYDTNLPTIGERKPVLADVGDVAAYQADQKRREEERQAKENAADAQQKAEIAAAAASDPSTATIAEYKFMQELTPEEKTKFMQLKGGGAKVIDVGNEYIITDKFGNTINRVGKGQKAGTKVIGDKVIQTSAARPGEAPTVGVQDVPLTPEEEKQSQASYDKAMVTMGQMNDDLFDAYNVALKQRVGGAGTEFLQQFKSSDEAYVRGLIRSVVGNVALMNLKDLKREGTSMGALSEKEMGVLEQTEGQLFPEGARPELALRNLARFINKLRDGMYGKGVGARLDAEQYRPEETREALQKEKERQGVQYSVGDAVNLSGGRKGRIVSIDPETGKAKIEVIE